MMMQSPSFLPSPLPVPSAATRRPHMPSPSWLHLPPTASLDSPFHQSNEHPQKTPAQQHSCPSLVVYECRCHNNLPHPETVVRVTPRHSPHPQLCSLHMAQQDSARQ